MAETGLSLDQLFAAFKILNDLDEATLRQQVILPVQGVLKKYQNKRRLRNYLLEAIGALPQAWLAHLQELSLSKIRGAEMWLTLAARRCGMEEPEATRLMINWLGQDQVNDRFKLELTRRLKDTRLQFYDGALADLNVLLNQLPKHYPKRSQAQEVEQNLNEAIKVAQGSSTNPRELYQELAKQHRQNGHVEETLLWKFRHMPNSLTYLRTRLKQISKDETDLVLQIIHQDGFNGWWVERLGIILDVYPRLSRLQKQTALPIIYALGRNLPRKNRLWQRANNFLADLTEAGGDEGELARKYWQKLGEHR